MPPSVIGYLCFLKSTLFQLYNKPSCQGDIRSRGGPLYAYYVTSMYFLLHECVSPVSVLNWVHWGDGKYPITFSIIECVFSYMRSQENHRSTHPQHVLISDSVSHPSLVCGSLPSAGGELQRHPKKRSASVLSTNQDLFIKHAAVKHREKLQIQPDIIKTVCISTDFSYRGILQEQFLYLCEIPGCRWISPLPLRHNSYQSLVLKANSS